MGNGEEVKDLHSQSFQSKKNKNEKSKSQINGEYFKALEEWLNDVRSYTSSCGILAGLPSLMMGQQMNSFLNVQDQRISIVPQTISINQDVGMLIFQGPQYRRVNQDQGKEYKIPPLWKRFAAEFIDFMLLFLMKLAITFVAVDFFNLVDLDDIDVFQKKHNEMDYKLAIEMTSEILFLEMIHRLIVCLYEGIFLYRGAHNQVGGATPGKTLMGIKVVLCYDVQQIGNDRNVVKVFPATNIGFGWSFTRAFLKNLVMALLFPFIYPLFINKFHRMGHDVLCNTIVVEDKLE